MGGGWGWRLAGLFSGWGLAGIFSLAAIAVETLSGGTAIEGLGMNTGEVIASYLAIGTVLGAIVGVSRRSITSKWRAAALGWLLVAGTCSIALLSGVGGEISVTGALVMGSVYGAGVGIPVALKYYSRKSSGDSES